MSKIVLKSLSVLLGAFFIFLGVLKVTPRISKDLHKDLRTEYAKYAKVSGIEAALVPRPDIRPCQIRHRIGYS